MDHRLHRLLDIARSIGSRVPPRDEPRDIAPLFHEASALLSEGLNPNTANEAGETPLGVFASRFRGSDRNILAFSDLLLSHGANPMLFDKPLGTTISHAYSSLLVTGTLSAIAKAEREGAGLRDERGGNVLHYLANVDPELAAWQLEEDIYAIANEEPDPLFFPSQMINQKRTSDGSTPLEVLWRPDARNWVDGGHRHAWRMTQALLDRGADPFASNGQGLCVFQEMDKLVQDGTVSPPMSLWGPLAAQWSQRELASTTSTCVARSTSPRF